MGNYQINCKTCGRKLLTYSNGSIRQYKSPVKSCKKCGTKYLDPRCHEIALEGIPSDTFSITSYLILLVIGALVLYRGIYLFGMRQLGVTNGLQWLMPTLFVVMGAVMVIIGLIQIILIITGVKQRKYDRLMEESKNRLKDENYVNLLEALRNSQKRNEGITL